MKECSRCGALLDREEGFHRDRYAGDGRRSICKDCASEANRSFRESHPDYQREWAQTNREHVNEKARERRRENPGPAYERTRRWQEKNPDKVREYRVNFKELNPTYHADWRAANRERLNEQQREKYWSDPEAARKRGREDASKRRARMKGSSEFEDVDHGVVYDRDEGICGICYLPAPPSKWQLDHIIPVSRGGPHTYANTRVSHSECNSWKKARLDEECGEVPGHIVSLVWQRYVGIPIEKIA